MKKNKKKKIRTPKMWRRRQLRMRLENYCTMTEEDLLLLLSMEQGAVHEKGYVYINRGAKVLAVCHADVNAGVKKYRDFVTFRSVTGQTIALSPALDDRLGIWLVMEVLKDLKMDVLITTGEESGKSTASEFYPDKDYNWIVEFDRRGADVVTYDYHNDEMMLEFDEAGFKLGLGSFSDISVMEHLGVAGFNVGIGYHQEHTRGCWANLNETNKQINKFRKFYFRNYETEFLNEGIAYDWIDDPDYKWNSPDDEWLAEIKSDEEYLSKFSIVKDSDDPYSKYKYNKYDPKAYLKVGCY
jgi:hypothetical protein